MNDSTANQDFLIDIDTVTAPYGYIPGFVKKYLKRIVHQDYYNKLLINEQNTHGIALMKASLDFLNTETRIHGREFLPQSGRNIYIGNHPMGGLEGIMYLTIIARNFPVVKSLSNDLLLNIKNLQELFVPVKVGSRQNREYVQAVDELYKSDAQVLIFPAGLVSRRIKGQIVDLEWKKSFVSKAIKYNRHIVPAFISGHNSSFFYTLANWRKRLRIKTNLEMLYLPDELYKQRNRAVNFYFGKPIDPVFLDKTHNHKEWTDLIKSYVYTLKENKYADFYDFMNKKAV